MQSSIDWRSIGQRNTLFTAITAQMLHRGTDLLLIMIRQHIRPLSSYVILDLRQMLHFVISQVTRDIASFPQVADSAEITAFFVDNSVHI